MLLFHEVACSNMQGRQAGVSVTVHCIPRIPKPCCEAWARILKLLRTQCIDSTESFPCENQFHSGIDSQNDSQCWNFKLSMGTRNRLGIGLSCRPARLRRLSELIDSVESISEFLKRLKIRVQEGGREGPRVKSNPALKTNILIKVAGNIFCNI
jgi:hypothetical protein